MREDMAKVIVERPRLGGGASFPRPRWRGDEMENLPRCQGMKRAWAADSKSLNENLAPLRRFLESNVGRPWNKVFSEICQQMNMNSAVQLHIWQHVEQYVCRNAIEIGHKTWCDSRGTRMWAP